MAVVVSIVVGVIVSAFLGYRVAMRAKRREERERDIPELNKHPERLEQMLDRTDDA